jgi:hypothetical protein
MLARKALAGTAGAPKLYVEDVFSCFLYTGNSSTNTITNGIDLSTEGGLVWCKSRASAYDHALYDTARGINKELYSNTTAAQYSGTGTLTAFNSNGFTLGANGSANSDSSVSWTFRKAKKFFDVVTYTGTGSPRTVSHNLGSAPGCIIVKRYDSTGSWAVWHRSGTQTNGKFGAFLNTTGAYEDQANNLWGSETVAPDMNASTFGVGTAGSTNSNGSTYVAYLFAHDAGGFGDAGSDSIIKCDTFTTASATLSVTLGWEPQWILFKRSDSTGDWQLFDNMRGMVSGGSQRLYPNLSNAEDVGAGIQLTATGFEVNTTYNATFVYIAIRRGPMKTPTDATKVFAVTSFTGVDATQTSNFPVDFVMNSENLTGTVGWYWVDRLRGATKKLESNASNAEGSVTSGVWDSNTTVKISGSGNSYKRSYPMFRRAPGFFDVVCYTGTGSLQNISHNLGVVPEMIIVKKRSGTEGWAVYAAPVGNNYYLRLDLTVARQQDTVWNDSTPTSSTFSVLSGGVVNESPYTYVAYLFASVTGVSKVFSYTGNGSSQTINCGFTAGARFILIKRTDSTGDWYVYDSARGIVSGNDPQLKLNSTAAEATGYDAIDPDNSGFIVNNDATNFPINVNNATYIGLAIA